LYLPASIMLAGKQLFQGESMTATCSQCNSAFRNVDRNEDGSPAIENTRCAHPDCEVYLCTGGCEHLSFACDACGQRFCDAHLVQVPDGEENRPLQCCSTCAECFAAEEAQPENAVTAPEAAALDAEELVLFGSVSRTFTVPDCRAVALDAIRLVARNDAGAAPTAVPEYEQGDAA
jgi:hypothetical protein